MGSLWWILLCLWFLSVLKASTAFSRADPTSKSGYRLEHGAGYVIVSPRLVRPAMTFRIRVSIHKVISKELQVVAHLSQDGHQYAQAMARFIEPTTKQLELDVPDSIHPGTHRLVIEGQATPKTGSLGETIFRNETILRFQTKYMSIFAQTDKPLYLVQEEDESITITYRIVGVTPLLQPVIGPIVVYVIDGAGIAVRRWRNEQLNIGLYENKFHLRFPFNPGNWSMRVVAFGHTYDSYFIVDYYYPRKIEVNVTVPRQIFDSEWGLLGTVYAEHAFTYMHAEGNATVMLRVRDPDGNYLNGEINRTIIHMTKETPFDFTMKEIREQWGDVTGHDLVVKAWFYDWFMVDTQNATAVCHLIKDGIKVSLLGRDHRAFKPNQPIVVYFAVTRSDGSPYRGYFGRQLLIHVTREGESTVTSPEDKVIIPDNGIVRYEVMPKEGDRIITVRAIHQQGGDGTREIRFFKYHNRNDQYLTLSTSTEFPEVDRYMIFTIKTNFMADEIQYVITAKGNILLGSSLRMSSHQKTFSIAVSREMTPYARLVAYTVNQGVVITDSITFPVKDSRLAGASLSLNQGKDFHRRSIELVGRSYGGGTMVLSGFQYQFYERGINSHLTVDDVMYDLMEYGEGHDIPLHLVWHHDNFRWESTERFISSTNGMDAVQTFNASGLFIFTDMNITDVPVFADAVCNITLGLGRCPNGQCYEISRRCDQILDCADGYDEMDCPLDIPVMRRPAGLEDLQYSSRLYMNTDGMFQHHWIKPNGQMEMKLEIPKSMQTFAIGGFALHPDEGLTIAPDVILYDTTRKFFMNFECPKTIRRGEQVGVRATLFNFQHETIEVLVTLHGSEEFKFVNVGPSGYTSSYAPPMTSGDIQIMVYMEPGDIKYIHFPVWSVHPKGEFEVTVSAYTFFDSDVESCTMNVEYDGILCEEFTPLLIDLVNQGSVIIPDIEIVIPEQFYHPEEPFHRYVPGSPSTVVSVFGDIVSPGFKHMPHWTSEDATSLLHDSADGYIADFAFNFQTIRYLEAVNALDYHQADEAFEFMRSVLAQIYVYLHPDGGMKMFRFTQYDKPSIWVTHFVLRWLHAAHASQWNEELYVPVELLNSLAAWLARQQNPNGTFVEISVTYDPHAEPFSEDADGNMQEWNIPLTAETVTTLCGLTHISGTAKALVDAAAQKGAAHLSEYLQKLVNPYDVSLAAYALHTCGHPSKDLAFHKLHGLRRETEFIYWSKDEVAPNIEYIQDTRPIRIPRDDFINLNHAMMATSYALMLYSRRETSEYAKMTVPIMKWINENRIGWYGWASNRDTLLGLQALTEFAMHDHNRYVYFMQVRSVNTNSPGWEMVHNINSSNFDEFYQEEVPVSHGYIKTRAAGTGYAMIAAHQLVNVERQEQLDNPLYDTYDITVPKLMFSGRNFSIMEMEACFTFVRPDIADKTHLTWFFIELPTGYVPNRDSILEVYKSNVTGLREINFSERYLNFFLEFVYVDQEVCLSFRADRWYPVANMTIQQVIRMGEYIETGIMWAQIFTTYSLHNLHICLVCGSYQCPYCPYYNHAPLCLHHQLLYLTFISVISALWRYRFQYIRDIIGLIS